MFKRCTRCNAEKPISAFPVRKKTNYIEPRCRVCVAAVSQEWRETEHGRKSIQEYRASPMGKARVLFKEALSRATERGLTFSLTPEWIKERIAAGRCEVTGLPFDMKPAGHNGGARSFGASLDRIDPSQGYTPGNTQVVVWIYNRAKGVDGHDSVMKLAEALCLRT